MGAVDNFLTARVKDNLKREADKRMERAVAQTTQNPDGSPNALGSAVSIGSKAYSAAKTAKRAAQLAAIFANPATWIAIFIGILVFLGIIVAVDTISKFSSSNTENQIVTYTEVAELAGCEEGDSDCYLSANCKEDFEGQPDLIAVCEEIGNEARETTF